MRIVMDVSSPCFETDCNVCIDIRYTNSRRYMMLDIDIDMAIDIGLDMGLDIDTGMQGYRYQYTSVAIIFL